METYKKLVSVFLVMEIFQVSSPNFAFNIKRHLNELMNFYFPRNQQKTYGFLMISGGIEVN